jgi:hypothetical protein
MRFNEFLGWVEYCTFGLGGGVGVGFIVAATVAMFTSEILRFAQDDKAALNRVDLADMGRSNAAPVHGG